MHKRCYRDHWINEIRAKTNASHTIIWPGSSINRVNLFVGKRLLYSDKYPRGRRNRE